MSNALKKVSHIRMYLSNYNYLSTRIRAITVVKIRLDKTRSYSNVHNCRNGPRVGHHRTKNY